MFAELAEVRVGTLLLLASADETLSAGVSARAKDAGQDRC